MEFIKSTSYKNRTSQLVIIECVVDGVEEIEGGKTQVQLKGCLVKDYDENILTCDSPINRPPVDSITATTLTRYLDYLPIKSGPDTVVTLAAEVTGDDFWLKSFGVVDEEINQVQRLFLEFKDGIAQGKNVRELSSSIGGLVRSVTRKLNYPVIPTGYTKNDAISIITNLESEWRALTAANLNLIKQEAGTFDSDDIISSLQSMRTDREQLRQYYLQHLELNPDEPCHVAFTGVVQHIEAGQAGYNQRVVFEQVQVLEYNNLNDKDLSDTIQELDHINCFVEDTSGLSIGKTVYLPARAIVYRRSESSMAASGLDALDVGIKALNWLPIESWLQEIDNNLGLYKEHLETQGVVGSSKINKKIKERLKPFRTLSSLLIDNSVSTIDEHLERIDAYRLEYSRLLELSSTLQEQSVQNSKKRWEDFLHRLTMDGFEYLATHSG